MIKLGKMIDKSKIKKYMEENYLSIRSFAKQCDMSDKTLGRILNGESDCRMINIIKICRKMGVCLEDLLIKDDE